MTARKPKAPPLDATERAELERYRQQAAQHDAECGAIAGASPGNRSDRIAFLADGLHATLLLMDSAMHAPPEHRTLPAAWTPALYMLEMVARDIGHENAALWDEVGPLVKAAREATP